MISKLIQPFHFILFLSICLLGGTVFAETRSSSMTLISDQPIAASVLEPIGQVVWVKGKVTAMQTGHAVRTLQRRSVIYAHDTLMTAVGASAEIVLTDSSIVTLRSGTQLHIDQYQYHPNAPGEDKYVANLTKGGFRTITGFISKGHPENYQVNTPVATIGVRGTIYTIALTSSGLVLEINQGAIVATNQAGAYELEAGKTLPYAYINSRMTAAVPSAEKPRILIGQPEATLTPAPTRDALQTQATLEQSTQRQAAQPETNSPAGDVPQKSQTPAGNSNESSSPDLCVGG